MACEMCSSEGPLFSVAIEGTILRVCDNCKSFGKVVREHAKARPSVRVSSFTSEVEEAIGIVSGYSSLIKNSREKLGLKQEELALKLNEKVSLIQRMESGSMEPSISVARKLEKFLRVKLVDKLLEKPLDIPVNSSTGMTIADMIKK